MNRYRFVGLAFLTLLAGGCGGPASDLPTPPPRQSGPSPPPGSGDIARRRFASPLSVADAERILVNTEIFGYSDPNPSVRAYNVVLDQPDALARFHSLAEQARWAGQLYSLCALLALDPAGAQVVQQRLSAVQDEILVFQSDVTSRRRVRELVQLIHEGKLWVEFRRLKEIPVRVVLLGQPFEAVVVGRAEVSDGPVDVEIPAVYAVQEVSGTFAGDVMVVAFEGATAAGGVKKGSLSIKEGPGGLPERFGPWQDGCVAVWRVKSGRPKPFRVKFTVTTDSKVACRAHAVK